MCLGVFESKEEGALYSLVGQSELIAPVSPFLAEVLLRVSLSVNFFGLFPPLGVLRPIPDSGFRCSWVMAFLFTEEHVVVLATSLEGEEGP